MPGEQKRTSFIVTLCLVLENKTLKRFVGLLFSNWKVTSDCSRVQVRQVLQPLLPRQNTAFLSN